MGGSGGAKQLMIGGMKNFSMKGVLAAAAVPCMFLLSSCYYDKYENFKPKATCDSLETTSYSLHVKQIFVKHCLTCHASSAPSGGVTLDNYEAAKAAAQSGKLLSSVTWDGNASFMPKNAGRKLEDCEIRRISNWINGNYAQ